MTVEQGPCRAEFERLYSRLKEFQQKESVQISSRTKDYLDCDAYRQIVGRGRCYLPYIVDKIGSGDFFLNQAMNEITGVNIYDYYRNEQISGEQVASGYWLRWWQENKDKYRPSEECSFTPPGSPLIADRLKH
jgi:hypothetical protein